jgi:hypothetical protein
MDANSIFRILVGVILLVGGLGWIVLVGFAAAMSDSDPDPRSTNFAALMGLVVAIIGGVVLALPLIFH